MTHAAVQLDWEIERLEAEVAELEQRELEQLEFEEALAARESLAEFVRQAWHVVEPGTELLWNWHVDLICSALERVTAGELELLVICVPPGSMKSLLVSVFWPAWEWLSRPVERSLFLSGSDSVRKRDSRRCRDVIRSNWYQRTLEYLAAGGEGEYWSFAHDQNEKLNFANSEAGYRLSATVGGKVTGDRADKQVLDDPYDVKEATQGPVERVEERMLAVIDIWEEVLVSRLNNAEDPRVLIMQRVHGSDLAGYLLETTDWENPKHEHIVIQLHFDPEFEYNHPDDPRTEEDENFFVERFPEAKMAELRPHVYSTQYQQIPVAKEGGVIKKTWCELRWLQLPDLEGTWVQSWDLRNNGKSKKSSFAVGQLWFKPAATPGLVYLVDEWRGQWGWNLTLAKLRAAQHAPLWALAEQILIENAADGRQALEVLINEFPGIVAVPTADGGKTVALESISHFFANGQIILPSKSVHPWVEDWVGEVCSVPGGKWDDRADAARIAIRRLLLETKSFKEAQEAARHEAWKRRWLKKKR